MKTDSSKLLRVILASSAGTLIEWYDFFIFGSLATITATLFFPKDNPTAGLLSNLAVFATGFVVRPFGAVVFGRIGDVVGRKYTFLVTLMLMGGSTFAIGLLPTFDTIGVIAPILLVALRLVQGLAIGGEYGGAATYVAEFAPDRRRGFFTSFIQTTAALGLLLSLAVVLATRFAVGEVGFKAWGWRIPFLLSAALVAMSYYIRMKLDESPIFERLKKEGKTSRNPLKESFASAENLKLVLLAMFGVIAGQGAVWHTSHFYSLYFLQNVLKVDFTLANLIVAGAVVVATPFYVVFGTLSDSLGRKKIMMTGCALAAVFFFPVFRMAAANKDNPVILALVLTLPMIFATMIYGPVAAFLVELFPARIRYTSMSLPYHLGNGLIGGLAPFFASTLTVLAQTSGVGWIKANAMFMGLAYPIAVASLSFFLGTFFLHETHGRGLWDEPSSLTPR